MPASFNSQNTIFCHFYRSWSRMTSIIFLPTIILTFAAELTSMGKKIIAWILLMAFGTQTFGNNLFLLDYQINKARFAKNCVNKARPQMHCNGQCQLMKKLRQQQKKEEQNPERKLENRTEVLSFSSSFTTDVPENYFYNIPSKTTYNPGNPVHRSFDIFHPPQH